VRVSDTVNYIDGDLLAVAHVHAEVHMRHMREILVMPILLLSQYKVVTLCDDQKRSCRCTCVKKYAQSVVKKKAWCRCLLPQHPAWCLYATNVLYVYVILRSLATSSCLVPAVQHPHASLA